MASPALSTLIRKRAELAGEAEALAARVDRLERTPPAVAIVRRVLPLPFALADAMLGQQTDGAAPGSLSLLPRL